MSEDLVNMCANYTFWTFPGPVRLLSPNTPNFAAAQILIRNITGYTFKKPATLCEALYPVVGEVACIEGHLDRLLAQGNRKMAMLGDTVMKTVVMDDLYCDYTEIRRSCGSLSNLVQSLITNENLCQCARANGIDRLVAQFYHPTDSIEKALATTVEAIIGAVWLDSQKDMNLTRDAIGALVFEDQETGA